MKNKKKIIKLLIFSHNNNYNIKIYNNISNNLKKKIKITNIISIDNSNLENLKLNFKEAKIVLLKDLTKKNFLIQDEIIVDNKIIKKYKDCEFMFYKMLDFVKLNNEYFKKNEKKYTYKYYLKIIINFLKTNKIDMVFFSHVPHSFFDVLFIQICKLNKIKILFTRAYLLPGFYLFEKDLFSTSLKKKKIKTYKNINPGILEFFDDAKNKFDLKNIKKNVWVDYSLIDRMVKVKSKVELFYLEFLFLKTIKYFLRNFLILSKLTKLFIFDLFKNNNFFSFKNYYFISDFHKKKNTSLMESKLNKFSLEKIYLKTDIDKFNLLKFYLQLSSKPNLKEHYIFFPLWFQPSSTTYPFAGNNINYLKCIKLLSKSLPKSWKIYVKESPDIFNMNKHAWFKGTFVRNKNFYLKLKKIKNVKLVNFDVPDFKLIDYALATATQADKFGLISVIRNKPNINFSNSIQKYCHGTFICKNSIELKKSIYKIKRGFKIDKKKVNLFFSILSSELFYRETIKGFNKYESRTDYSKISKLLESKIFESF